MVRFLAQRMEGASSAAGALAAYIRANAEFVAAHRAQMKAMLEIFMQTSTKLSSTTASTSTPCAQHRGCGNGALWSTASPRPTR